MHSFREKTDFVCVVNNHVNFFNHQAYKALRICFNFSSLI